MTSLQPASRPLRPQIAALGVLVLLPGLLACPAQAQSDSRRCLLSEASEVRPGTSDPVNDRFGCSSALSGDHCVVGALQADVQGTESGSATVFRRVGESWSKVQTLLPSGGAAGNRFGRRVAMSGEVMVVGSHLEDGAGVDQGAAYVFRFDGSLWQEEQRLVSSDSADFDEFGSGVDVCGDLIAVGAWRDDPAGSVTLFRWNGTTWAEEQKLAPGSLQGAARFGNAVALDGTTLVAGAVLDSEQASRSGAAYVYEWDGSSWTQQRKLMPATLAAQDEFGHSVAIDQGTMVVSAWRSDERGPDSGSIYVYENDGTTWQESAHFLPYLSEDDAGLGRDVSIRAGFILAATDRGRGIGVVYHRQGGSWAPLWRFEDDRWSAGGYAAAVGRDAMLLCRLGFGEVFSLQCDDVRIRHSRSSLSNHAPGLGVVSLDAEGDLLALAGEGLAEIYRRRNGAWAFEQDLVPTVPTHNFGSSAAVSGPVALIGTWHTGDNQGGVHVFRNTGSWNEEQYLQASDGDIRESFGSALDVCGSWIAVGALAADSPTVEATGAVYMYEYDGQSWIERQKILRPNGKFKDWLGYSVALQDDILVVGAAGIARVGGEGKAFVYRRQAGVWVETQVIEVQAPMIAHGFGQIAALDGDLLAIGGYVDAVLYRWDGAQFQEEEGLPLSQDCDYIFSLAVEEPTVVLNCSSRDGAIVSNGNVLGFLHTATGWQRRWSWVHRDEETEYLFGQAAAVCNGEVFTTAQTRAVGSVVAALSLDRGLALDIQPRPARVGESAEFRVGDGEPGRLGMIAATRIAGVAGFWRLYFSRFDRQGELSVSATITPDLVGLSAEYVGLGFDYRGKLGVSDPVELIFQPGG